MRKEKKEAKTHKVSKPLADLRQTKRAHFLLTRNGEQNSRLCFQSSATHLRAAVLLAAAAFARIQRLAAASPVGFLT
jgi:hypothetical protein